MQYSGVYLILSFVELAERERSEEKELEEIACRKLIS